MLDSTISYVCRSVMSRATASVISALAGTLIFVNLYSQLQKIHSQVDPSLKFERATGIPRTITEGRSQYAEPPRKPRILCWIQTWPGNHMTRAIHVKQTWGSRCDILLFMSSQKDDLLGTIALPGIQDGHDNLWLKTQKAFQYIWEHYREDADWFFRADDDAYVFMDDLRSLLNGYDPTQPHYLGCTVDWGNNTVVNLGFSFAVSKEALRLFIQEALPHPEKCFTGIRPLYKGDDDTEFGMCLQSVGVLPRLITDEKGRSRFDTADPVDQMEEFVENHSMWEMLPLLMSDRPISYQLAKPSHMYVLEFFTQYLRRERKPKIK